MHTEVVASIKNRDEILALDRGLGALHLLLSYVDKKKFWYVPAATLVFALGLMSKQTVISFAVIIPLLLQLFRHLSLSKTALIAAVLSAVLFL